MLTQKSIDDPTTDTRSSAVASGSEPGRPMAVWGVTVLIPLIAALTVTLFHNDTDGASTVGAANSMAWPRTARSSPSAATAQPQATAAAPVSELVAGLEQRLTQDPGDAKGWALLAQSHAFLGHAEAAESAVARAVALGMDASELRRRVGLAASNNASQSTDPASATAPAVVHGTVDVTDDALAPRLEQARGKLFVTARIPNGPPMPVAVLAADVSSYPFEYSLSDDNAMLRGTKLSDYAELAVSARLALSGTAERSEDDLESQVVLVSTAASAPVDLLLRAH